MANEKKLDKEQVVKVRERIKAHALEHYSSGGWDVVVECWEDGDLDEIIEDCSSFKEAFRRVEDVVDVYADRQADARNCW